MPPPERQHRPGEGAASGSGGEPNRDHVTTADATAAELIADIDAGLTDFDKHEPDGLTPADWPVGYKPPTTNGHAKRSVALGTAPDHPTAGPDDDQTSRRTPTEPDLSEGARDVADPEHEGDIFFDWPEFWAADREDTEFVFDGVLVRGRGHAIFAKHKDGKSLFALWMAAQMATRPDDPCAVINLDFEMPPDDVRERLEDMGYGPETDLSLLRYAQIPALPPLDTPHGGNALLEIVDGVEAEFPGRHIVVIIDTTSRVIQGKENDADPYQDFYRYTGMKLKGRGCTFLRLDHEGKDPTKGQRGSSAKGDDIDIGWKLAKNDAGITLKRDISRIGWVDKELAFAIGTDPLRYVRTGETWPNGTQEAAHDLDRIGYPLDGSGQKAQQALKEAGTPHRRQVAMAAVKYRRRDDYAPARNEAQE